MSYWTDSANQCAKCGCELNGYGENVRSCYDEDVCYRCDAYAGLTDDVMNERAVHFNEETTDERIHRGA